MRTILFSILLPSLLFSFRLEKIQSDTVFLSIPKTGTHIICALLAECAKRDHAECFPKELATNTYHYGAHLFQFDRFIHSKLLANRLKRNQKTLILVRDLRDVACSFVTYIERQGVKAWPPLLHSSASEMAGTIFLETGRVYNITRDTYRFLPYSIKKRIDRIWSAFPLETKISHFIRSLAWELNISKESIDALQALENSGHILLLRFEDICPEAFGGSYISNLSTLEKIISFYGLHIEENDMHVILDSVVNHPLSSRTFIPEKRQKIGQWKSTFSEKNKSEFEVHLGTMNRNLGYL